MRAWKEKSGQEKRSCGGEDKRFCHLENLVNTQTSKELVREEAGQGKEKLDIFILKEKIGVCVKLLRSFSMDMHVYVSCKVPSSDSQLTVNP